VRLRSENKESKATLKMGLSYQQQLHLVKRIPVNSIRFQILTATENFTNKEFTGVLKQLVQQLSISRKMEMALKSRDA